MSEYNLKKSEEGIGQLYPILEAEDGEIIDGFHREKTDPNWKRVRLEHIDTEEKKLIARLVANSHRRLVSRAEKEEWINGLASVYKNRGLKVRGHDGSNEIKQRIIEVTGVNETSVTEYLSAEFKQKLHGGIEKGTYQVPASQRIEKTLGREYIGRHREEVKQELLKDKDFQRQVLREIQKPHIVKFSEPCPSGVCEIPNVIEGKPPVNVVAERLEQFWRNNPNCMCKKCKHYGECGVIR